MATIVTELYRELSFAEAVQIANTTTGALSRHYTLQWGRNREHDFVMTGAWADAWLDNGVVRYLDGSPIPLSLLHGGLGDNDPTGDYDRVAIQERGLRDISPETVVTSLAIDLEGAVNNGTKYSDSLYAWINPGDVNGGPSLPASPIGTAVYNLLGGDDVVFDDRDTGAAGPTYNMGAGNDRVEVRGLTRATIIDGTGSDWISIEAGLIKATLDGEDDTFLAYGATLSYETAKKTISNESGWMVGVEIGRDTVSAYQLIGGSGDDWLADFDRITGGKGSDTLAPQIYGSGGDGNDTLIADNYEGEKVTLLGDAGADTFIFRGSAEATGGAGLDRFVFEEVAAVKIADLKAGEKVDLSALLDVSVADAFAQGHLKQTVSKGYTYLSIDQDGGGDDYVQFATFKGVFTLSDYLLT